MQDSFDDQFYDIFDKIALRKEFPLYIIQNYLFSDFLPNFNNLDSKKRDTWAWHCPTEVLSKGLVRPEGLCQWAKNEVQLWDSKLYKRCSYIFFAFDRPLQKDVVSCKLS